MPHTCTYTIILSALIFCQIADETVSAWSSLSPDDKIELQEEYFMMTIKGITRTCFGNAFNSEEEVRKMAKIYHTVSEGGGL